MNVQWAINAVSRTGYLERILLYCIEWNHVSFEYCVQQDTSGYLELPLFFNKCFVALECSRPKFYRCSTTVSLETNPLIQILLE